LAFFVGLLAQAEIAVAGGCMQRRLFLVGIRHAERHVVRPQHFEHLVILKPRRVPELEGGAGPEGAERAADPADCRRRPRPGAGNSADPTPRRAGGHKWVIRWDALSTKVKPSGTASAQPRSTLSFGMR